MSKTELWRRASELFDRVADLQGEERERILSAECAGDPALRAEVERLLRADQCTSNPLDRDIVGEASTLLLDGDAEQQCGQRFGPYKIVRLLAQGGMGRVYLAQREDADFTQTVALKLVGGYGSFDAGTARARFLEERRILARLEHPHIARLLDGGVGAEAQPWFAMEYVDGAPLTEWCDARKLGVNARLELFAKVCDAVDHAHRFLIVHRDLKPGNVLVDARGEPKVLDFGIAKLLDEGERASDRAGSTILMTPDYAAPEQLRGGQISTATDVYGLGAVLFELLTGRKPFVDPLAPREPPQASRAATEDGEDTGRRAADRGTTPKSLRKTLRGDLDRILRAALDQNPQRRYRSAAVLAEDLRAVAQGHPISLRRDRAYRIGVFLRQHRLAASAASAAVLALLGTTGWALWQQRQAIAQAQEAARQAEIAKKEALASEKASDLLISAFEAADPNYRRSVTKLTAEEVLDASAARVSKELAEVPEVRARIQLMLGRTYLNLGHDEKAIEMLEASTASYMDPSVNRPGLAADAMVLQSMVEGGRENHQRAIDLARRAVDLKRHSGSPEEEVVNTRNTLGMALIMPGHYEEAERELAAVHDFWVKTNGMKSKSVSKSFNTRGYLANVSGNPFQAERLYKASLTAMPSPDERSVYITRGVMALAIGAQGRFSEAEAMLEKNIRLATQFYDPKSTKQATLYGRLGEAQYQKGDLVRAEANYQHAFEIEKNGGRENSIKAGNQLGALAQMQEIRGDATKAARNYQHAEETVAGTATPSDLNLLRAIAYREAFKARQNSKGWSNERLKSALSDWIAIYGTERKHVPSDLADALFLEAERRLATGQTDVESVLPLEDPTLEQPMMQVRRHYWLARTAQAREDRETAAAEYRRALEIADRYAGRDSVWPALWRLDYASLLQSDGKPDQARAQLQLAEAPLKAQMVPEARVLARMERLRHERDATQAQTAQRIAVSRR